MAFWLFTSDACSFHLKLQLKHQHSSHLFVIICELPYTETDRKVYVIFGEKRNEIYEISMQALSYRTASLLFGSVLLLLLSILPGLSPPSTTFAEQHKHSSVAPNKHAKPHVVHRFRSGLFALSNCNTFSLSFDDKTPRPNKFQHIPCTPKRFCYLRFVVHMAGQTHTNINERLVNMHTCIYSTLYILRCTC